MKIRDWLNNNSALVTIVTIMVLILALVVIIKTNRRPRGRPITSAWYYDTGTGELFVDVPYKLAPFEAPSGVEGAEAVSAIVFHCGSCKTDQVIAYLSKYTDEYIEHMQIMEEQYGTAGRPGGMGMGMMDPMTQQHQLIAEAIESTDPEDIEWMSMIDPEAMPIMQDAFTCPSGDKPNMTCRPGK